MSINSNQINVQQLIAVTPKPEVGFINPTASVQLIKFADGTSAVVDGAISIEITQSLNQIFAKEKDAKTGIILENYDLEMGAGVNKVCAMQTFQGQGACANTGLLYGVNWTKASTHDLVALTDAVGDMTPEQINASAVIFVKHPPPAALDHLIAPTLEEYTQEAPFARAVILTCLKYGVPFYKDAQTYATAKINKVRSEHVTN